jgi:hypothetical protein
MDKNQKASLGCGTLILIALIVLIFANIGGNKCAEEVSGLRAEVRKLEETLSIQTRQIQVLEQTIRKVAEPASPSTKPAKQEP